MKDKEKKVKAAEEEAKKEVQTEEEGVQLTDENLSSVAAAGGDLSRAQGYAKPHCDLYDS